MVRIILGERDSYSKFTKAVDNHEDVIVYVTGWWRVRIARFSIKVTSNFTRSNWRKSNSLVKVYNVIQLLLSFTVNHEFTRLYIFGRAYYLYVNRIANDIASDNELTVVFRKSRFEAFEKPFSDS